MPIELPGPGPEDPHFVPDFFRCDTCGNTGTNFTYDPNPKGLPPVTPPMIAVEIPVEETEEERKRRIRSHAKMASFAPDAELRARLGQPANFPGPRGLTDEKGNIIGLVDRKAAEHVKPAHLVNIADVFGCARTGEPGAERCGKCQGLNVRTISSAEQCRVMLNAAYEWCDKHTSWTVRKEAIRLAFNKYTIIPPSGLLDDLMITAGNRPLNTRQPTGGEQDLVHDLERQRLKDSQQNWTTGGGFEGFTKEQTAQLYKVYKAATNETDYQTERGAER